MRLRLALVLTLSLPLLAATRDTPLVPSPGGLASSGILARFDFASLATFDTAIGVPAGLDRTFTYSSVVLAAPITITPGAPLPAAAPPTGAVPSFHRWLASDEAEKLLPAPHIATTSPLIWNEPSPLDAAFPLGFAGLSLGALSFGLHRVSRRNRIPEPLAAPPVHVRRKAASML